MYQDFTFTHLWATTSKLKFQAISPMDLIVPFLRLAFLRGA
jgi:hypothetical protein